MSRSPEDRLVLSSRYIHTGNSGVTVTVRRDLVRPDRAELEVENGAFGAFHSSILVKGHDTEGMTAIQLRDLALMFLDAADALDKDCKTPYVHQQEGYASLVGKDDRVDLVHRGGGNRNHPPQSLRRFFELPGIAMDPGLDFAKFKEVHAQRSRKDEIGTTDLQKPMEPVLPPAQRKLKKQRELEERNARERERYVLGAGYDYLMAKRMMDILTPVFKKAKDDYQIWDKIKFGFKSESEEGDEASVDSE